MKKIMSLAVVFYFFLPGTFAQCVKGSCYTGYGEYVYPDGSKYVGDFLEGKFHGKGVLYLSKGDKYVGHWRENMKEGLGRYTFSTGQTYKGGFHLNEFHGQGYMKYKNGDEYDGEWAMSKANGVGVYKFASGERYEGEFVDGKFEGKGTMYYLDGARFQGNWKNNKKNGNGTLYSPDGKKIVGEWRDGKRTDVDITVDDSDTQSNGQDIVKLRDCNSNFCATGTGVYSYMDGSRYVGEFKDGEPNGEGVVYYANGDKYEGGWRYHGPYGEGIMYYADGRIVGAVWENGKAIVEIEPKNEVIPITDTIVVDHSDAVKVWAVIVGVGRYKYMPSLKYSDDDAYRIYGFLKSPEGGALPDNQIRVLVDEDATREKILLAMQRVLLKADDNDAIIFYFSGHGVAEAFLPSNYDGYNNRIRHKEIVEILEKSRAKSKLLLSDACYAGNLLAMKGGADEALNKLYNSFRQTTGGLAVILSSKGEEYSLEDSSLRSGIFSYYLFKGLKGAADSDGNKIVAVGELFDYVYKNVRSYTANAQTPVIKGTFDKNMPVGVVFR